MEGWGRGNRLTQGLVQGRGVQGDRDPWVSALLCRAFIIIMALGDFREGPLYPADSPPQPVGLISCNYSARASSLRPRSNDSEQECDGPCVRASSHDLPIMKTLPWRGISYLHPFYSMKQLRLRAVKLSIRGRSRGRCTARLPALSFKLCVAPQGFTCP